REGQQELVADVVAKLVVDRLEAIQIQIEQGDVGRAFASVVHGGAQVGGELDAVGQTGELVVHGLVGDLIDELAVLKGGRGLGGDAGEAVEQIGRGRQPVRLAI